VWEKEGKAEETTGRRRWRYWAKDKRRQSDLYLIL